MSHVATIDLEIRDLEALEAAAKQLGLELVHGQKTYEWFGQHVRDYPLPAGFKAEDLGKCEHAIRIPGKERAYEVGVVARRDGKEGYQLLWDFWNRGYGLQDMIGDGGSKLIQEYAVQVSTLQAEKLGLRVERETSEDGFVTLRAM